MPYYFSLKCSKCGKFMAKNGGEWREQESPFDPPLSPYVYQDWKCKCGNTCTTSYDFRYPQIVDIHDQQKGEVKDEMYGL
jgi:hypothetical protein